MGIVLAETPRALKVDEAPPELLVTLRCDDPENQEHRDYVKVEDDAWTGRRPLDVPLSVISNDFGASAQDQEQQDNVEAQKGWLERSRTSRQVVVTSGHDVPENEPGVVVGEIEWVLDQIS